MRNRTPAERVTRGSQLLDRMIPGWFDRIDLDILDISHTTTCILGQLFNRDYYAGLDTIQKDPDFEDRASEWGFNGRWPLREEAPPGEPTFEQDCRVLKGQWTAQILSRRS